MKRTATLVALIASLPVLARAGTLSGLTTADSCAYPFVSSAMAPVDYFFDAGPKVCKSLCQRAASQCKGYVKGYASCAGASYKNGNHYALENCALVSASPAALHDCRDAVNASYKAQKGDLAELASGQVDACAQWGKDCVAACVGAPL